MNQNMGNYQYGGGYRPPQKNNNNQNIVLWICVGLLSLVLLLGILSVGFYFLGIVGNDMISVSSPTPSETSTPSETPTSTPTSAQMQTPEPPPVSYLASGTRLVNAYSNSGIYVRSEASTQSGKIAYISAGDTGTKLTYIDSVNAFDTSSWMWYTWYYVRHPNGSYGYVRSDVVRISSGNDTTSYRKKYLVNAFSNSGIYVRARASTKSDQLAFIPAGNTSIRLEYLSSTSASDGTWYYVRHPNGFYGYVRSDVVRWW